MKTLRRSTIKATLEQVQQLDEDMAGLCTACGHEQGGCEPDARKYECEACGANQVYGADELMMSLN